MTIFTEGTHEVTGGYHLARGTAQVTVSGNAFLAAYDNARITAYDDAGVMACDNTELEAHDRVRAEGYDNAIIAAHDQTKVTVHGNARGLALGGHIEASASTVRWIIDWRKRTRVDLVTGERSPFNPDIEGIS